MGAWTSVISVESGASFPGGDTTLPSSTDRSGF
jgi:hypothetical protein